jgi:hypothetical protein
MKRKLLKVLLALFFLSVQVMAQQKAISGKVTSADDGKPLPGVSIKIKGTTTGVITDINGAYSLQASKGQVLACFFFGFLNHALKI